MQNLASEKSIFRNPSRGETIFLAILVAFFLLAGSVTHTPPFHFADLLKQNASARINSKPYDGPGIVIAIDDETFESLGRSEWTRADLAQLIERVSTQKPAKILIERQFFAADDQTGITQLRDALEGSAARIYWQFDVEPKDILSLSDQAMIDADNMSRPTDKLDIAAQGLVEPVAMVFRPSLLSAPIDAPFTLATSDGNYRTSANVLSGGSQPGSNLFPIDLAYIASTVPEIGAYAAMNGDFGSADLSGKAVVISLQSDLSRDFFATPNSVYTSRAAATLIASRTLETGPPREIGWFPAFIVIFLAILAWMFVRRPFGTLIAVSVVSLVIISAILLERSLIYVAISQGLFLFLFFAVGKLWKRGRDAIRVYRNADETKSKFLAQASHDLRQPIHAIGLLSERLSRTDLSPEQEELVSKISWSVDNASRMFRALLDVAAIESGTLKPDVGPVVVNELLAEVDIQNALAAEQAGVDLRLVPSDLVVRTDRALIGTMLQNLVSNAIKYSPGKTVVVGCRRQGDRIALQVVDNGRGISSDDLKHVRKEFFRSSKNSSLRADDKGLGLAIVNRLAILLNLKFALSSQEGQGTVATIKGLPVVDRSTLAEHTQEARRQPLSGLQVTIADDDVETLKSTQSLLEQWGCGVEAFDRFPTEPVSGEIFLSDFDFGHGDTLADRQDDLRRIIADGTKVIVISGHHPDTIHESIPGLAKHVLSKPLRAAELRSALMSVRIA